MLEQLKLIADFYYRPLAAASRVLDHGRFFSAVILAIITAAVLQLPAQKDDARAMVEAARAASQAPPMPGQPAHAHPEDDEAPPVRRALPTATALSGTGFGMLLIVAAFFVPTAILLLATWDGLGSSSVVLRREYVPLLMSLLFAWVAARLPVAVLGLATLSLPGSDALLKWAMPLSLLYFLVLSALCIRTVLGVSGGHAVSAVVAACAAGVLGQVVYVQLRPAFYMLASPWLLYYGYMNMQGDFRSFGQTLRSRQNLRRGLEAAAINPHDADAQYQLGLIYRARRNFTEAEARFRKTLEIDPAEPDALFELGRLLREQKRVEEALPLLEKSAKLNDKQSSSEVWREIGAARIALGQTSEAVAALSKYVDRREYDPEGLYWLGVALKQSGRLDEARTMLTKVQEAVDTSPSHRRPQLRRWGSMARAERKSL